MRDEFDDFTVGIVDGGAAAGPGFKILKEDGFFFVLEDGTGFLLLES